MYKEIIIFFFVFAIITFLLYSFSRFISKRYNNNGKSTGRVKGYVYIISNPSFKSDIYKIGMTERTIAIRIKELFTTGVPTPFVVEIKIAHSNPQKLEDYLHMKFHKYRINNRREFFKLPLGKIRAELNSLALL